MSKRWSAVHLAAEHHMPASRHGKNINSDMWRQMQLWRGASNPAHPFCRFHTGNYETLMSKPKVLVQLCRSPALCVL
jgi:secreted Zn-dependent insulinase-like peptidase